MRRGEQVASTTPRSIDQTPMLGSLLDHAQLTDDFALASDLRLGYRVSEGLAKDASTFMVGGYVRDLVRGVLRDELVIPQDLDFEVSGMGHQELAHRLSQYGTAVLVEAASPVVKLINPQTRNELEFSASKSEDASRASLRESVQRRDLTINGLQLHPLTGELIDLVGGVEDLRQGILRAINPERFAEDPLRALRVAQFAARFGFTVDPATFELCASLDMRGIKPERIGDEWVKLLTLSDQPSIGMELAQQMGILRQLHPDLEALRGVPQEPEWHPEGDVWAHTKLAVDAAARIVRSEDLTKEEALIVLLAALCHDLGKPATTTTAVVGGQPRIVSHKHEIAGIEPSRRLLRQMNVGRKIVAQILPLVREHLFAHHNQNPTDKSIVRLLSRLGSASIKLWDLVCRSDSNGKGKPFKSLTSSHKIYERAKLLMAAEKLPDPVVLGRHLIDVGVRPGPEMGRLLKMLHRAQVEKLFDGTTEGGVRYFLDNRTELVGRSTEADN